MRKFLVDPDQHCRTAGPALGEKVMVDGGAHRCVGRFRGGRFLRFGMVICGGIALSGVIFILLRSTETYKIQAEFNDKATEYATAIERTIENKLIVLESLRAFLKSHYPKADRKLFAEFTHPLLARVYGIGALEWLPRVAHDDRAAFEAGTKQDMARDYQITERDKQGRMIRAGRREEYFPVLLMKPYKGNELALGYDPGSCPTWRRAMEHARDTGAMTATNPIRLVQNGRDPSGLTIFAPLYIGQLPRICQS